MHVLIAIAVKSLFIAGLTLGLLALMKKRSAAERSWVAHIGLLALVIMALAPLVLPRWNVEAPALLGRTSTAEATVFNGGESWTVASAPLTTTAVPDVKVPDTKSSAAPARPTLSATATAAAVYAIPTLILLFVTALALARLITLQARAEVLVDGHWLSALARAQRRMGFKHGTALLTSNELSSPISWGVIRPVIVLNNRAVEATGEAEAIIAHELAHVARFDWAKLLLARVATAFFWFNPFVWLLAREAHQLREEAADDAVLAADIVDTDYAQLLVGVARHECPGLLLGAHGVAPSKNSLARRVARVLDGKSVRGPVARSFALGVFAGAVLIAAPLAALTLTPGASAGPKNAAAVPGANPFVTKAAFAPEVPTDLPHIIANGVSTSVATVASVVAVDEKAAREARVAAAQEALAAARTADKPQLKRQAALDAARDALADARQARQDALADAQEAVRDARKAVRVQVVSDGHIDAIIEMKAAGVDPAYVYALRTAQPRLRSLDPANFAGMKAVGVTPAYARELAAAGLSNLTADQITEAKAVGLTGEYVRAMAATGLPLSLNDYVQLRAVGVPIHYVLGIRKAGYAISNADKIVQMWAVGVHPEDLKVAPVPPTPPRPPRLPKADDDPGDG
jgi:beta-lactamase regulating signal transducer with metallopeptidase domain